MPGTFASGISGDKAGTDAFVPGLLWPFCLGLDADCPILMRQFDHFCEFSEGGRFYHISVRAQFVCLLDIRVLTRRSHDDGWNDFEMGMIAYPAEQFQPGHA